MDQEKNSNDWKLRQIKPNEVFVKKQFRGRTAGTSSQANSKK